MRWIQAEDGSLVNLDHVQLIEVMQYGSIAEERWKVQTWNGNTLADGYLSRELAQEFVDELGKQAWRFVDGQGDLYLSAKSIRQTINGRRAAAEEAAEAAAEEAGSGACPVCGEVGMGHTCCPPPASVVQLAFEGEAIEYLVGWCRDHVGFCVRVQVNDEEPFDATISAADLDDWSVTVQPIDENCEPAGSKRHVVLSSDFEGYAQALTVSVL